MDLFKKFSSLFSTPHKADDMAYWLVVRCKRCGEVIRARVDLRNDLSVNYGDTDSANTYFCRKVLIGEGQCFQKIEVELTFDANHHLINRQVKGGQFAEEM